MRLQQRDEAVDLGAEPANALSVPTWAIHVSSLVEWLVAMALVWRYAEVTGRPVWKGLTWGMLPLHTSGICACTYHFFYNAPELQVLVALQAGLTAFGNTTCAYAAYRVFRDYESNPEPARGAGAADGSEGPATADTSAAPVSEGKGESPLLVGFEDLADALRLDDDATFLAKLTAGSVLLACAVKYGSLLIDAPFEPSLPLALAIIFVPTGLNCLKWLSRSREEESGDLLM